MLSVITAVNFNLYIKWSFTCTVCKSPDISQNTDDFDTEHWVCNRNRWSKTFDKSLYHRGEFFMW